jgi:hypothetical protein
MLRGWQYSGDGRRDLRIDWLRGLAMTCVIIDHSRLSSLLSWFSYERFWTVTAAEVFVVLSGAVLGMVYGGKLKRGDWRGVARGLSRRAATLYLIFFCVTVSLVVLGFAGVDVTAVQSFNFHYLDGAALRDIALMRVGPWAFQIMSLYVWLVAAALPCLLALRYIGWAPLLGVSWSLYLLNRLWPHTLTSGQFELTFPLLAWQLLFVHGIAFGYHRERVGQLFERLPRIVPMATAGIAAAFIGFALCNPWTEGPGLLHWTLISPERFSELYYTYFNLEDLGIGRLLNLAVGLPLGYAVLTAWWRLAQPFATLFVTLGQQSLGAFVLHVYAIMLIAHTSPTDSLWLNTVLQVAAILVIAALLRTLRRLQSPRTPPVRQVLPIAA